MTGAEIPWTDQGMFWLLLVQTVVLVVAAAFAGAQIADARRDREARDRPFVVVELELKPEDGQFLYIVVRNIGLTVARNVTFEFTPELVSTLDTTGHPPASVGWFDGGIPTLSPRQTLSTLLDIGPDRVKAALPESFDVVVTYAGDAPGAKVWIDVFTLDLALFWSRLHITRNGLHEIHAELKKIRERLQP